MAAMVTPIQADAALAARVRAGFCAEMAIQHLPTAAFAGLWQVYLPLADWVHRQKPAAKPLLLGVNGAQGAGKSTLCAFLRRILREAYGYNVAAFSIDDLYLTRAERQRLARQVHPLLATRGVPGTHDAAWGRTLLQQLADGGSALIPSFDKAADERRPPTQWTRFDGPADVVIFEGWCVGTRPQTDAALCQPINVLERREDPFAIWRRYVNQQLAAAYADWFALLDRLLFLQVPSMDCVIAWRGLQEQKLAMQTPTQTALLDAAALWRFVMHYERLTRHALDDLPHRADLTLPLNDQHALTPFI